MKLLYLSVDGKNVGKEFQKIYEIPLKDYFTPEVEDPIFEFQFEEDFSLYAAGSNVIFAVQGEPDNKEKAKILDIKGRQKREGDNTV